MTWQLSDFRFAMLRVADMFTASAAQARRELRPLCVVSLMLAMSASAIARAQRLHVAAPMDCARSRN